MLCAAQRNGVARVVNSSSSSVYGDHPTHLMQEDMQPNPRSAYALQKPMGEQYAGLFARLHRLTVVSLRYFNVYGPGQPSGGAYALVIQRFLRMKGEGLPLTVYRDCTQTRSYTHVSDLVETNVLAATTPLAAGSHTVLNIGTDVETSANEIAAIIGGPVGHVVPNPRAEFEEARKTADYSKARSVIGWEPKVPFPTDIGSLM